MEIKEIHELAYKALEYLIKNKTCDCDALKEARETFEDGLTCLMCRKPKEKDGQSCCEDCGGLNI